MAEINDQLVEKALRAAAKAAPKLRWRHFLWNPVFGERRQLAALWEGYRIEVRLHDYRQTEFPPGVVYRSRPFTSDEQRLWIEVKVADELARDGRRSVLPDLTFLPEHPLYVAARSLYDAALLAADPPLREQKRRAIGPSINAFCKSLPA